MKKTKDYTLLAILIPFAIAVLTSFPGCYTETKQPANALHVCADSSHVACDGKCECDGLGCAKLANLRDYQLDLHNDTVWLYDGERLVGRYINNWDTPHNALDSIIMEDNR